MKTITCVAPVNIAVIKYWGKRNEDLILPINDSVSSTLSLDYMYAKTTVMINKDFKENKFWLNGTEEPFDNARLNNCLKEVKKRAQIDVPDFLQWKIHVCSENNFPTAAGLASSAAGYACLVFALSKLYCVEGDISAIARRGSGSACRSVYGGWVQWHKGQLEDGSDSFAAQIVPASHWPEIRILILVVNDARKKHSSTSGMKRSMETSPFLKYRAQCVVPSRVQEMIHAIKIKDFKTFAELTMKDSNQFHSVCLDTFPPCVYMNDVSHAIIDMVHAYNNCQGSTKVAYTFDAGPNACLYTLESDVPQLMAVINHLFPSTSDPGQYFKGIPFKNCDASELAILNDINLQKHNSDLLKYIIHTKVGEGPKILSQVTDHLLGNNGFPINL